MKLPAKYAYLRKEPIPPLMVRIALDMLGTIETPGTADNAIIVGWADEVEKLCKRKYDEWAADFYNKDSIPWCGLFMAVVAARASQNRPERFPPNKYLAALAWSSWGNTVASDDIQVGDVVVLVRQGGGHVMLAVGGPENGKRVMGIGGNQADRVSIAQFDAARIYAVRRPPYQNKPEGARRVVLKSSGKVSTDRKLGSEGSPQGGMTMIEQLPHEYRSNARLAAAWATFSDCHREAGAAIAQRLAGSDEAMPIRLADGDLVGSVSGA